MIVLQQPKVSIIIPFYNCAFVDQAIRSALNQTYENVEVIVVNDGSTQYSEKIAPYMERIRYVEQENGGTASALNTGIRHATGEYFAWLSSDDLYHPKRIAKQLAFMLTKQAEVSYASYYHINAENKMISGPVRIWYDTPEEFCERMKAGCFINGCTVMVHMSVFSEVGLFDETLRFTQDYDLWLRIMKRYRFHYFSEPLVMYRLHDQMGSKRYDQELRKEIAVVQQRYNGDLGNDTKSK